MSTLQRETVMFDVHDFKVAALTADNPTLDDPTYDDLVDVPGIAEVGLDPNIITAELKGDARVMAKKGRIDRFNLSFTYGKLSLDVLNVLLGGTITDGGTAPSRTAAWELVGKHELPYFFAAFAIDDLDVGLSSLHTQLFKCQITGGTLITGQTDEFGQPTGELEAIPLESNDRMIKVELYEEPTDLAAYAPLV